MNKLNPDYRFGIQCFSNMSHFSVPKMLLQVSEEVERALAKLGPAKLTTR